MLRPPAAPMSDRHPLASLAVWPCDPCESDERTWPDACLDFNRFHGIQKLYYVFAFQRSETRSFQIKA